MTNNDYASILRAKILFFSLIVIAFGIVLVCIVSCTLSLQNISTHGTATDLVDENQSPTDTISPEISVPAY